MQSGLYIALAGQRVIQTQLQVVANNVANINTTGFRAETVSFDSLVSLAEPDGLNFPVQAGITPSLAQGTLTQTGSPLDMAIAGDGWFAIATPAGTAYTRDGRMVIDTFGELRTVAGHAVLDSAQAPIVVNPNGGAIDISPEGRITQDGRTVGDIGVFELPADAFERRYENAAFVSETEAVAVVLGGESQVRQGFIERSNVNATGEMANLITITRIFESLQSTIADAESALQRAIREIGSNQG